jgi:hypothetical protein
MIEFLTVEASLSRFSPAESGAGKLQFNYVKNVTEFM